MEFEIYFLDGPALWTTTNPFPEYWVKRYWTSGVWVSIINDKIGDNGLGVPGHIDMA